MNKLTIKQKRKLSIFAIISIISDVIIMYIDIHVTTILDNPFGAISYLLFLCVGFFSLFALVIDLPNTY